MAKQNLPDRDIQEYIIHLSKLFTFPCSKNRVKALFGAYVGLVADDYPERAKEYLDTLLIIANKYKWNKYLE